MTVTQLINEACGASLQNEIRTTAQELASVQAGCNVHWIFRPSIVDLETGMHGIRHTLVRILQESDAVLPLAPHSDTTPFEFRNVYLAKGLTTDEIANKFRAINGFDKYPNRTIADNLSTVLKGIVASVQMTSKEDLNRTCKRPRVKWYLIAE